MGDIGGSGDIFRFTLHSTIHDFILIGEGNLALTMFGNTYLLSNIMLLALYNRAQPMKNMAKNLLTDKVRLINIERSALGVQEVI